MFAAVALLFVLVNWNYVETRYITNYSRYPFTQITNGFSSNLVPRTQPRRLPPSQKWTSQTQRHPGSKRILTRRPHISSPDSIVLSQPQPRQYVQSHSGNVLRQSINSVGTVRTNHKMSISGEDSDDNRISIRTRMIQPRFQTQTRRPGHIQKPNSIPNWSHNNALRIKKTFDGRKRFTRRKYRHNIMIRTHSGQNIKISHSLPNTNIVLGTHPFFAKGLSLHNRQTKLNSKSWNPNPVLDTKNRTTDVGLDTGAPVNDIRPDALPIPTYPTVSIEKNVTGTFQVNEVIATKTNTVLATNTIKKLVGKGSYVNSENVSKATVTSDKTNVSAKVSSSINLPTTASSRNTTLDKSRSSVIKTNAFTSIPEATLGSAAVPAHGNGRNITGAVTTTAKPEMSKTVPGNGRNNTGAVTTMAKPEMSKAVPGNIAYVSIHQESPTDDVDDMDPPDVPDIADK